MVALWAIVMGSVFSFVGCFGHICDGDVVTYGRNANEGELINADTWESNPVNGQWLAFPRQRVWFFELHTLGDDRLPAFPIAYVSAQSDPEQQGGNSTVAAGNLAEFSGTEKGKITVKNDTCADYFLRVVVTAAPRPEGSATPAPPSATDAGIVAPGDAGGDADATP
jgi:hypothetical protein